MRSSLSTSFDLESECLRGGEIWSSLEEERCEGHGRVDDEERAERRGDVRVEVVGSVQGSILFVRQPRRRREGGLSEAKEVAGGQCRGRPSE